jgi:antitoxin component of MazEF toxin-antitoxin module
MTVTIKVWDRPYLNIPESLSKQLRLVDGDEVEVLRWGDAIALKKRHPTAYPRRLRDLAGIVKSSRPRASVDVSQYMTRRGYEYLHVP